MPLTSTSRRQILASLAVVFAPSVVAAATVQTPLSSADGALVARAVSYLDGLTCAKGRFEQIDARGSLTRGSFFLQRPGRARFDYDPPSRLVIAANGFKVTVVDHRLKTIQSYPLGFTPLGLFLARNIHLDHGVMITSVDRTVAGFSVTVRDRQKPAQGSIELTFTGEPIRLAGWTVTDSRDQAVQIRLTDLSPASRQPGQFFELSDPSLETGSAH